MHVPGWKAVAGLLVVAIGGLVVWADEGPATKGAPPAKPKPSTCPAECPEPAPTFTPPTPPPAGGFALPDAPAVCPKPSAMPDAKLAIEIVTPPAPVPAKPAAPVRPLAVAVPVLADEPPAAPPEPVVAPAPPPAVGYAEPVPVAPPAYAAPVGFTTPPAPPAPPLKAVKPVVAEEPVKVPACQLHLKMGEGRPRFEIRSGDVVLMKVTCDRVDMQSSPDDAKKFVGMQATGRVQVHGYGLDGSCDQLLVMSMDGQVVLKGGVKVQFRKGRQTTDLAAEQLSFVVSPSGLTSSPGVTVGMSARSVR